MGWVSVSDKKPIGEQSILAWDGSRMFVAIYYEDLKTIAEIDDSEEAWDDMVIYDSKEKAYWKEGFYEHLENQGFYDTISYKRVVTHWQPLPEPPSK